MIGNIIIGVIIGMLAGIVVTLATKE